MKTIPALQFGELFRRAPRWIDVRAPIEFADGAIPGAANLPLLNDDERHRIGIVYKDRGQAAAVALGEELVRGSVKDARVRAWRREAEQHPDTVMYCFRGGMRSAISQSWLCEAGVECPIVEGGYKALRRFLLSILDEGLRDLRFEVVSGPTGSGKTEFLKQSGRPFIDLEAAARHRGSAFGLMDVAQPSQADFENAVALQILRVAPSCEPILIENESRMIGQRVVPETLFQRMKDSPRRTLHISFDQRVENIFKDYVMESPLGRGQDSAQFAKFRASVESISRKLGGLRTQEILRDLEYSQSDFLAGHGLESNRVWIAKLLEWYYDPVYRRWGE